MMETRSVSWISWRGWAAAGLFLLNTLLLFFPPIPPLVKGSLWAYVLKAAVVALLAWEVHRGANRLAARWASLALRARWAIGLGTAAFLMCFASAVRWLAPELFVRFSAEVGPWESISTACFACGFVLLWRVSATCAPAWKGHLRAIASGYGLMFLEETDYAGIFGSFVGRVDGVYVGSLHDMLNLSVKTAWDSVALTVIATVGVVASWILWRSGWVQPRLIGRTLRSGGAVWLLLGMLVLAVAAVGEAGLAGSAFMTESSPEEAVEMAGGICFAAFALEVAAGARGRQRAIRAPTRVGHSSWTTVQESDIGEAREEVSARRG